MDNDTATAGRIAALEAEVEELRKRADSLSASIINACTGSGCLNAHELRVALDAARSALDAERAVAKVAEACCLHDDTHKGQAYSVILRDRQTGERRKVSLGDSKWDESSVYWWTDGNMGCDCNRSAKFDYGEKLEDDGDMPCGSGRYTLEWVEFENGDRVPFEEPPISVQVNAARADAKVLADEVRAWREADAARWTLQKEDRNRLCTYVEATDNAGALERNR